uniref:Uncharacterized protein n=1 Tax=Pygocentrus nattereri TaxID=42514 RepID=A0A3B4EKV8_PYGNA
VKQDGSVHSSYLYVEHSPLLTNPRRTVFLSVQGALNMPLQIYVQTFKRWLFKAVVLFRTTSPIQNHETYKYALWQDVSTR